MTFFFVHNVYMMHYTHTFSCHVHCTHIPSILPPPFHNLAPPHHYHSADAHVSQANKPRKRGELEGLQHPLLGDRPTLQLIRPREETQRHNGKPGFLDWWFLDRPEIKRKSTALNSTPMKIEPKTFFANERTFLSWLHMAVTIGSIACALLGFAGSAHRDKKKSSVWVCFLLGCVCVLGVCVCVLGVCVCVWVGAGEWNIHVCVCLHLLSFLCCTHALFCFLFLTHTQTHVHSLNYTHTHTPSPMHSLTHTHTHTPPHTQSPLPPKPITGWYRKPSGDHCPDIAPSCHPHVCLCVGGVYLACTAN